MVINIVASICFSIVLLILMLDFFSKKKIEKLDNNYFRILSITNLVGLFTEIIIYFLLLFKSSSLTLIIITILGKIILLYYLIYMYYLLLYTYTICWNIKDKNDVTYKKTKTLVTSLYSIFMVIILLLPCTFEVKNNYIIPSGLGLNLSYIIGGIGIITIVTCCILKRNAADKKKIKILIGGMGFAFLSVLLQFNYQELLLLIPAHTISLIMLYLSIENPNIMLLEEVSLAKESAERANNAKTDFLSNMSHEIRTPLNAIVGFSESLKEDNLSQESKDKVNYIITASNNLLEIVNGILDISKIEANKLEIINKEYDVRSLLDELVSLTKARIGDKELDFRVNIDQSIPSVLYGDNTRLKQIILNLLTNAVKYTKEGFVDFTVSTVIKDNVCRLIISVEDSGIGIKEENLSKLFSKFERLDVEKQITIEGTGLGLAITEKLVELMNGKIVVQSVFGKGSKFTVSIDQRIIAIEKPEQEKPAKAEAKIVNANGAKILLVDDNELNIKVASVLLKKYNFNIDSCTSGLACIAKINNGEQYDIIFMDDMMPRMSGRETLQKLKSNPDFKIPIIALTANAITGMKEEYLKCGFDDYLSKPIEKLELERVIKKYVNKLNSSSINTNLYNSPKSIIKDNLTIELPVLSNEKEQQDNLNNKKILLVDDNELNIKVAQTTLKKYNFDITSVTSGSSCIEKAIDNKYDLILLDDMMPELDGCTTLDNLKTLENFNTPVVMMTASSYDEVEEKIKKHGFDGYLAKPINKEELDKVLENLLN